MQFLLGVEQWFVEDSLDLLITLVVKGIGAFDIQFHVLVGGRFHLVLRLDLVEPGVAPASLGALVTAHCQIEIRGGPELPLRQSFTLLFAVDL